MGISQSVRLPPSLRQVAPAHTGPFSIATTQKMIKASRHPVRTQSEPRIDRTNCRSDPEFPHLRHHPVAHPPGRDLLGTGSRRPRRRRDRLPCRQDRLLHVGAGDRIRPVVRRSPRGRLGRHRVAYLCDADDVGPVGQRAQGVCLGGWGEQLQQGGGPDRVEEAATRGGGGDDE